MDFSGRIGRRKYILAEVVLMPLGDIVWSLLALASWNLNHSFPTSGIPSLLQGMELPKGSALPILLCAIIAAIVIFIASLSFGVRRLHDLDFSGFFLLFWPFWLAITAAFAGDAKEIAGYTAGYSVAFEVVLMMVPGIPGPNIYGPSPRATGQSDPRPR